MFSTSTNKLSNFQSNTDVFKLLIINYRQFIINIINYVSFLISNLNTNAKTNFAKISMFAELMA